MPITIAIADDHPVVRRGLVQFFAEEEDLSVVAECSDGGAALEAVREHRPDILILDLRMPRGDGISVLQRLQSMPNAPRVIVLAGDISDADVVEVMRLGAKGIVLKELAPTLLVQCIRKVAAGGLWFERESAGRVMEKLIQDKSRDGSRDLLTPRERDIVRMVASGLSNRELSERLFITEGTVKSHLHAIYEKLGLKSRLQLAAHAREHGLV
jgi:DNA-binding NarL/FixJ family response regulator